MGSLNVQPPSALRNVTEVFIYFRNNRHPNRSYLNEGFNDSRDETFTLIALDGDKALAGSSTPPAWVSIVDEISYELDRLQSREKTLKELQQKHLKRPDFSDEASSKEQEKIKDLTEELTKMFTHIRRLIRLLQDTDPSHRRSIDALRENVISSFLFTLNNLLNDFRSSQSHYVLQIDARKKNVDSFLLATEQNTGAFDIFNDVPVRNSTEELTIDQLQAIVENESMVRDREKEVVKISKSILELNTLFKDLASLVTDQGTILDRIDYNIEQSVVQIKSAYQNIQKAERYQRNRKMHMIMGDTDDAVPVANNSNLLYLSMGFLFTIFSIIGGFIVKLYYDERQSTIRAEAERMIRGEGEYRPPARDYDDDDESVDEDGSGDENEFRKKIGKKKAAKLQAKHEARVAREAELRAREERKQREAEDDRKRQEEREKEEMEEKRRQEEERIKREEREKRELEEYLKLKDSFVVEGEGQDAKSEEEKENMMKNFVDFIKKSKVVYLDELAPRFQLDVESTIEKINFFLENGVLTGVFDDRGKFIYISEEEMAAVAKFINQRGRISLQDLADYSNQLISFESRMGD